MQSYERSIRVGRFERPEWLHVKDNTRHDRQPEILQHALRQPGPPHIPLSAKTGAVHLDYGTSYGNQSPARFV